MLPGQDMGLVMSPSQKSTYVVPNVAPFNAMEDFRFEFRMFGFKGARPTHYSNIWKTGMISLRHGVADYHTLSVYDDSWVDGYNVWVNMKGRSDVLIRIQRYASAAKFTVEIWDTATAGNYVYYEGKSTKGPRNMAGKKEIGGPDSSLNIAWAKWHSSLVPIGAPPPILTEQGDLATWTFQNSTEEQSNRLSITSSTPSFAAAPLLTPVIVTRITGVPAAIRDAVIRVNQASELDASTSYGDTALEFTWKQVAGPSQLQWSSTSVARPTVVATAFGEYKVKVRVIDRDGQISTAEMIFGAVRTNANDVVIHDDPMIEFVFGPMMRLGASPWPWLDVAHVNLSRTYGELVIGGTGLWARDWQEPLEGAVSSVAGSKIITGVGTKFQTDFCGGPGRTKSVGEYPVISIDTPVGRVGAAVAYCDSDTQLRVSNGEENVLPTVSYTSYSKTANGRWWGGATNGLGGSNNANYYDNVLAHYALYYRSGLTKYLVYARTLADNWFDSPFFVRKHSPPRTWSLIGIMWRAYEGQKSEWWTKRLFQIVDQLAKDIVKPADVLPDIREDAYKVAFTAIASKLTPDSLRRPDYRNALIDSAFARFSPSRSPEGNWINPSYGYATWNGKVGRVNVQTGSTTVIGIGTTASDTHPNSGWNSKRVGSCFWIAENSLTGDPQAYRVVAVPDATTLVLDRPYEGPTRTSARWQISNLCGPGTQPFMMGIVGTAWGYAYKVTDAWLTRDFAVTSADWLSRYGIQQSTKGLYYGRLYVNCEPITDGIKNCSYDPNDRNSVESSRMLNGEVIGLMATAYGLTQSQTLKECADTLVGGAFGKLGGPATDSIYVTQLEPSGGCCPKNFGFYYGIGRAYTWPAARIGPSSSRSQ